MLRRDESSNCRGVNAFYGMKVSCRTREKYCNLNFLASILFYSKISWKMIPTTDIESGKINITCLWATKLHNIYKIYVVSGHPLTIIWKILTSLGEKIAKNANWDFLLFYQNRSNSSSRWSRKLKFGQVMENPII